MLHIPIQGDFFELLKNGRGQELRVDALARGLDSHRQFSELIEEQCFGQRFVSALNILGKRRK
jgi:hypothetical protein